MKRTSSEMWSIEEMQFQGKGGFEELCFEGGSVRTVPGGFGQRVPEAAAARPKEDGNGSNR